MELQISYSVCPELPQEGIFPGKESGNREDTAAVVRVKRGKDHRSGSVSQPYPPVCRETTENVDIALYGVSEREEQYNAV